jgi:hypothetical protein
MITPCLESSLVCSPLSIIAPSPESACSMMTSLPVTASTPAESDDDSHINCYDGSIAPQASELKAPTEAGDTPFKNFPLYLDQILSIYTDPTVLRGIFVTALLIIAYKLFSTRAKNKGATFPFVDQLSGDERVINRLKQQLVYSQKQAAMNNALGIGLTKGDAKIRAGDDSDSD